MKPVINLDELDLHSFERGPFAGQFGPIAPRIGAKKLGYSLTICPPGKKMFPVHNHQVCEEMFFILEGEGTLKFGDEEFPLRAHDVVACPPGGREVAHQIVNTGTSDLKFLSLSTLHGHEIVEYPDSDKVAVLVGKGRKMDMRLMFRAGDSVDYYDGEVNDGD